MDQRRRLVLLVPLLLAAALFLPSVGKRIIYIGDEARYALLARNMLESGDWLVPRMDGEVHMEKSPLFMWAIAALSLAGGNVTELTATLPAALSGIGGVGATMLLGRRLFGARAGLLAAFVLATTWGYYWHARLVLADMMVTFFVVAAAAGFWAGVGEGRSRRLPLALCWACLGLGFSAKGPAGLMPVLPFAAFLVAEHGWTGVLRLRPLMGVAIVALISAPWALAFALQEQASYVRSVLLEDYLGPRLRPWDRASELFFAFGPIGVGFLPWTPFVPAAVRSGWWKAESADVARKFRFLGGWVLAYVIVITLLPHKRDRYLLPVHPALALMVGWLWDRWAARAAPRVLRVHCWVWGGMVAAMAVAVQLPLRPRAELAVLIPPTLEQKLVLSGLLLAAAVVAVAMAGRRRPLAAFGAICASMAVVLAWETHVFVAGHNRAFDVRALSRRLVAHVGAQDQLVTYQFGELALEFYTGRTIREVTDPRELEEFLAAGRPLYVITPERAWQSLSRATGRAWTIVDRAEFGGRPVFVVVPGAPS